MSKNILEAHDLALRYRSRSGLFKRFEHTALKGVSFELKRGETLGILGRNGCGKSTLLRLLAGIIKPTSGTIVCDKQVRRALLILGLGFRPDLTGRDNALLSAMLQGSSRKQALAALPGIHKFSELREFFDQPVKTYSAGMRARLSFATAIETEVDVLLLDEVLSVGDAHFKKKAEKVMLKKIESEQTVVFVSHSAAEVNRLCDRALWLEDGVVKSEGDVKTVSDQYGEFIEGLNAKNGK
ncbi:MAG: ABC transporter [Desulfuromonas sp.]|nr:MAG: ABC transporter [Desulfuromonas sp.]